MDAPGADQEIHEATRQVLRLVGDFAKTHPDTRDWLTIVVAASSTLLAFIANSRHMLPDHQVDEMLDAACEDMRASTWAMLRGMDSTAHKDEGHDA
jgi:hypothetical protein